MLLSVGTLIADIAIIGKKEMVARSSLIAVVDIQELVCTDKTQSCVDLIATGYVGEVLKGEARGEIKFRIPRFFPCAAFDVSTGRHLVFLEKNEKGEYEGVNWYMSYQYLGFDDEVDAADEEVKVETFTPQQARREIQRQLKESKNRKTKTTR